MKHFFRAENDISIYFWWKNTQTPHRQNDSIGIQPTFWTLFWWPLGGGYKANKNHLKRTIGENLWKISSFFTKFLERKSSDCLSHFERSPWTISPSSNIIKYVNSYKIFSMNFKICKKHNIISRMFPLKYIVMQNSNQFYVPRVLVLKILLLFQIAKKTL